jgi:TetR/AcrR family transcriptional regulator
MRDRTTSVRFARPTGLEEAFQRAVSQARRPFPAPEPRPRATLPVVRRTRARAGERSIQRRAEILRSASAAFARRGFHGASVEEIARTLGMRKGNLYYYFRNKEEILFFCHDYSLDLLLRRLDEVGSSPDPPDRKLRKLVVGFVHVILDELQGSWLTHEMHALSPGLLKKVIAKRDEFESGVRGLIREGMDAGVFQAGDAKLASFAVLGSLNWITRWYSPDGERSSDEIADCFARFVLSGLRSSPSGESSPA